MTFIFLSLHRDIAPLTGIFQGICHQVTDNGIGIPANEQKKMFKSLFRGNNAINLQITGSGIGMLLTYKLIKSHAGKISMSSIENVGTTFKLAFPIKVGNTTTVYSKKLM